MIDSIRVAAKLDPRHNENDYMTGDFMPDVVSRNLNSYIWNESILTLFAANTAED
jgi:hypothetical protein